MANAMYTHNLEEALSAIASGTLKVVAVGDGYTYSAAHTSINDVTDILRTSDQLTSVTVTSGTLDAADVTLTAMTATKSINAIILYTVAASSASSTLHVYLDSGTGFDVVPNGGNIIIQWNGSGIYTL